jgi:hypothetical protein
MKSTDRIKKLLASQAKMLPITDKTGMPVGFADSALFLSDGIRLAARISLAEGSEEPIKKHCQTLFWRRGADDYAKGYVRTVWELQDDLFKGSLVAVMERVGDVRQGFVDGFDNAPATGEPCS